MSAPPADVRAPDATRPSPRLLVATTVLVSLALTAWWLTQDSRVPDADSGGHMATALEYRHGLLHGDPLAWFTRFDIYPPLIHLIGAFVPTFTGVHVAGFLGVLALIFVPMLAVGCYGAATVVGDERAGALAVVIALGAPMVVSLSHTVLLDGPLTALTAVAVWCLLASDGLRRPGWTAAAGVAIGLGMLTKNTFVVYVAGLIAVQLARGGWRQWRGIAALVAPALLIAGPWYLYHAFDQAVFGSAASSADAGTPDTPPRFSYADLSYYGWAAINAQLYLPLTIVCAAGAVARGVRWLRTRADDGTPELLVGLVFGWFVITNLGLNSPRYTLPLLVYLAALGASAVVGLRGQALRRAVVAVVVVAATINAVQVTTGDGPTAEAGVPGATKVTSVGAGRVTLASPAGYLVGGPHDGGGIAGVLRDARDAGVRRAVIEPVADGYGGYYTGGGITFVARWLGGLDTPVAADTATAGRDGVLLFRRAAGAAPGACAHLGDGSLIFLARGSDLARRATADRVWCPGGAPRASRALRAPAADEPPGAVRLRARLLRLFTRLRARGVEEVVLHSSLVIGAARGPLELAVLARSAGLRVLPARALHALARRTGAFVFVRPQRAGFPAPCATLPDRHAVYALPGGLLEPLERRPALACA